MNFLDVKNFLVSSFFFLVFIISGIVNLRNGNKEIAIYFFLLFFILTILIFIGIVYLIIKNNNKR